MLKDESKEKGRDAVDRSWVLAEAWVKEVFTGLWADLFLGRMCWGFRPSIFHTVCGLVSQKTRSA